MFGYRFMQEMTPAMEVTYTVCDIIRQRKGILIAKQEKSGEAYTAGIFDFSQTGGQIPLLAGHLPVVYHTFDHRILDYWYASDIRTLLPPRERTEYISQMRPLETLYRTDSQALPGWVYIIKQISQMEEGATVTIIAPNGWE